MTRPPFVAFAGSRDLPLAQAAGHILIQLAKLPDGSTVLLRHPKSPTRDPGRFERLVDHLCAILDVSTEWYTPEGSDRGQTYLRDLAMVEKADYAVAFFPEGAIMEGGTGHVVEAALSKRRSVEAYAVAEDGVLTYVGTYDPVADA